MRVLINALAASVGGGATTLRPLVSALLSVDGGAHDYELVARADICDAVDPKSSRMAVDRGLRSRSRFRGLIQEQGLLPIRALARHNDVLLTISSPAVIASPIPQVVLFRNAAPFTPELYSEYRGLERARLAVLRGVSTLAARRAAHVVFISRSQQELIAPHLGIPTTRTSCVYLGRSLDFAPEARGQADLVLARYGVTRPYVLCVSQFYKYKNLVELVEGFAIASNALGTGAVLALAGAELEKEYAGRVRAVAERRGVLGRIRFLGPVPHSDLPPLYASAELFVFPSRCESFPNILVEGLASGVATVTSRFGPMPELAQDAAAYVDVMSPDDIARGILDLWRDEGKKRLLAARGVAQAAKFSWEATARSLLRILEGVAAA